MGGNRTRKRTMLLALVTLGAALLAACGTPEPTAAPTAAALAPTQAPAADTQAPPPGDTPLPTSTLAPSHTPSPLPPSPTATPMPSDTPVPTDTPLPPTDTPVPPTATAVPPTKPPAPTPRPPTATSPPAPAFPWRGQVVNTFPNCGLTQLKGLTLDRNGGIAGDIWVHWWADGWEGAWGRSTWAVDEGYEGLDDSRNWDGTLENYAKAGTWHVCIVPAEGSWDCRSTTVTVQTAAEPCAPDSGGVQIVRIVFQQN
jgi:hypothetical protein